jgi:hypothetical protein
VSHDETLVGLIAVIFAIASLAIAVGPWDGPYRLPTMLAVSRRYGKPLARGIWVAIALASLTAGVAILTGLRPSYAVPSHRTQLDP